MFRALRIVRARTPLSNAFKEWLVHIKRNSARTQETYRDALSRFLSSIPDKPIGKLTSVDIRNYLDRKLWIWKRATANVHLTAIKSFCKYLAESYDIPNVADTVKTFKREPPNQHFINHEQYLKVLSVCTPKENDIIRFLGCTGLRASEACGLAWDSIEPQLTRITVIGKGNKVRIIPLNETCREILRKHYKTGTIIFPKSRRQLHRICRKAGDRVNIHLNPHSLRHYFATELLKRSVKIAYVSRLLGHSSIAFTEKIYIHFLPDYLSGVTDVLD